MSEVVLRTDGDAVEAYREAMRPEWTPEDGGLAQLIEDAQPAVRSTNTQGATLGGIAYEALVECLRLDRPGFNIDIWDVDEMETVLTVAKAMAETTQTQSD